MTQQDVAHGSDLIEHPPCSRPPRIALWAILDRHCALRSSSSGWGGETAPSGTEKQLLATHRMALFVY
jgi:hypothetical protein